MKIIVAALAVLCMSTARAAGPARKRVQSLHRSLANSNVKADGMFAPVFDMERRLESMPTTVGSLPNDFSMPTESPAEASGMGDEEAGDEEAGDEEAGDEEAGAEVAEAEDEKGSSG